MVIGAKRFAVPVVLTLVVAMFAVCFPTATRGVELAGDPDPPPPEQEVTAEEQYAVHDQYPVQDQYGTLPDAPDDAPLGAGGPPTAEVNPQAQYEIIAPIPTDCGTYENPCSSDGVTDAAQPAAEDAHTTDNGLGEAYENDAGLVDAGPVDDAQAAEPSIISPSGESVAVVSQYGAVPAAPADVYDPVVGDAANPEQTASTAVVAPVRGFLAQEVAQKAPSPNETPSAQTETRSQEREPARASEKVTEEGEIRPANPLSVVPLSATGGSLILALSALLYRRFGR